MRNSFEVKSSFFENTSKEPLQGTLFDNIRMDEKSGISFVLDVPYFACFRRPASTNLLQTYKVVPFTTIRGLIANALEYERDNLSLQDKVKIGIQPIRVEKPTTEMCKILKLTRGKNEFKSVNSRSMLWDFPSSPMFKSFLIQPRYRIYAASRENSLVTEIASALSSPKRPLYLGQSDDMVVVDAIKTYTLRTGVSNMFWSLIEGVHPECSLLKLPYQFESGRHLVYSPLLSVAKSYPIKIEEERDCVFFGDLAVQIF